MTHGGGLFGQECFIRRLQGMQRRLDSGGPIIPTVPDRVVYPNGHVLSDKCLHGTLKTEVCYDCNPTLAPAPDSWNLERVLTRGQVAAYGFLAQTFDNVRLNEITVGRSRIKTRNQSARDVPIPVLHCDFRGFRTFVRADDLMQLAGGHRILFGGLVEPVSGAAMGQWFAEHIVALWMNEQYSEIAGNKNFLL